MYWKTLDASRVHLNALREVIPPRGPETMSNRQPQRNPARRAGHNHPQPAGQWRGGGLAAGAHLPTMRSGARCGCAFCSKALIDNAIRAMSSRGWSRREADAEHPPARRLYCHHRRRPGPGMTRIASCAPLSRFHHQTRRRPPPGHRRRAPTRWRPTMAASYRPGRNPGGGCLVTVEFRLDGDPV